MSKKLTIAVIGAGDFGEDFVPLFKAHPLVEKVYVCDKIRSKAEDYSKRFQVETIDSFEDVLQNNTINCVAIFTQRHLHGSLVKQALLAGKHVYSAVPMATHIETCQEIIELVKQTGLVYMMGETCYYYPCAEFCRQKYRDGTFGTFVYGEAQYYHDLSHFPKTYFANKQAVGVPPLFYSTHSISMVLSAAHSHVEKVVAFGYRDREPDGYYAEGANEWNNPFSNEYALMQLANGGTIRINECRRIGYKAPSSYISAFYGTEGAYQFSNAQHLLTVKSENGVELTDVSDLLNPTEMTRHKNDPGFKTRVANHEWQHAVFAPVQDTDSLPPQLHGLHNAHMASHHFLVNDFCRAVYEEKMPALNAWTAARFTIPGILAHESALQGGLPIDVPDFGDPPVR